MELKVYVDASSAGYGAFLLGDEKTIAIFSCGSSKPCQHSTTSEMKGPMRSLRAFRSCLIRSLLYIQSTRVC